MLEREFQPVLKEEIERRLPGCKIFKQDPNATHQGIPDLLILHRDRWAMLETKRSRNSATQANQDYWVEQYNNMAFSAFVDPENMSEVLDELEAQLDN